MIHRNTHIIYITHITYIVHIIYITHITYKTHICIIHIIYITDIVCLTHMVKLIFKSNEKADKTFFLFLFFLYMKNEN